MTGKVSPVAHHACTLLAEMAETGRHPQEVAAYADGIALDWSLDAAGCAPARTAGAPGSRAAALVLGRQFALRVALRSAASGRAP